MKVGTFNRPKIELQPYAKTPKYTYHGTNDDRVAIPVCRIKVWKAKDKKWFDIPVGENCLTIREVESIEVTDSYNELLGKAVIRFPRGTIVEKAKASTTVSTDSGVGDDTRSSSTLESASQKGDFLEYYMQEVTEEVGSTRNVKPESKLGALDGSQVDAGLTELNQHLQEKSLLDQNDFTIGNRIEIYLGYAYSEGEFNEMQQDNNKTPLNLEMIFTGFITKCSVSTPLEVECENMAHVLTTVNVPDILEKNTMKLSDFLADDGKYHILKDTGIELSKSNGESTVEIGKFHISSQLTVADVLAEWSKSGIVSFMENNDDGTSTLRVGKVFYAGLNGDHLPSDKKDYITYTEDKHYNIVQFDWDVASDNLSLQNTDKKYLAVRVTGRDSDGKFIHFTIRKTDSSDGNWDVADDDDQTWSVVNEKVTRRKKKTGKVKKGTARPYVNGTAYEKTKNKVDLSNYTVIPYISQTIPVTKEKLLQEAKLYWTKYVPNGINGTLTIFGDLKIKPADIIGLIDPRQPQKNGYYLVESVSTTFGLGGYRKELKLPFKVAKFKDYPVYKL